ncbi:hypothetical protein [Siccirubricoccus sp. G192]|uniref:hypothetical protein n=1 Tax=Siccirubricoccus sp. G192 TaxID=2849651 RepID=UPI0020C2BE67|nr:hypothetical protein [Siccirubricoccus sp. G192]
MPVGAVLAALLVVALPGAARPRLPDAPQELLPPQATEAATRQAASPRGACLDAARRAERIHGLPQGLLVAIALSESGLHAHALSIGGRAHYPEDLATARRLLRAAGGAAMAGCVQVNAGVHARGSDWPLDAERSADWAGGLLRRWFMETGSWAAALRRWHGGSPASSRHAMCRVRAKLEVTAPRLRPAAGPGLRQRRGGAPPPQWRGAAGSGGDAGPLSRGRAAGQRSCDPLPVGHVTNTSARPMRAAAGNPWLPVPGNPAEIP